MQLTSSHFTHNSPLPKKYTCDGDDISPALQWADIPNGTKSFVLIVRDPDAPAKAEWTHWIVVNIPAITTSIPDNTVPVGGREVMNDFGQTAWGSPCPPDGEHRYFFQIYALGVSTISGDTLEEVETAMADHILAKAELIGLYTRGK